MMNEKYSRMLPPWGVDDRNIYAFFNGLHVGTSYVFATLIGLHILAAIKHLILPHHGVFKRILTL